MKPKKYIPTNKISRKDLKTQAQEVKDRLDYFYLKIDGSYEWLSPHEAQLLPLVHELVQEILSK